MPRAKPTAEKTVMVAVPESLRNALKVVCAQRGEKMGVIVAKLIREWVRSVGGRVPLA